MEAELWLPTLHKHVLRRDLLLLPVLLSGAHKGVVVDSESQLSQSLSPLKCGSVVWATAFKADWWLWEDIVQLLKRSLNLRTDGQHILKSIGIPKLGSSVHPFVLQVNPFGSYRLSEIPTVSPQHLTGKTAGRCPQGTQACETDFSGVSAANVQIRGTCTLMNEQFCK